MLKIPVFAAAFKSPPQHLNTERISLCLVVLNYYLFSVVVQDRRPLLVGTLVFNRFAKLNETASFGNIKSFKPK